MKFGTWVQIWARYAEMNRCYWGDRRCEVLETEWAPKVNSITEPGVFDGS